LAHPTVGALDWLASKALAKPAEHQLTGRRGEEDAYFYLRKLGYLMVARNFRSPRRPGEIDLIGGDKGVLCFVEVKTRTTRDVKPAEAAVGHSKQHELAGVAREYLPPPTTFVPVALRCSMRVLSGSVQPAGVRVISECLPGIVE